MTTSRIPIRVSVNGSDEPADDSRDGLEHWLQDLRTDPDGDAPDWLDRGATSEEAVTDEGRHHVDDLDPQPTYGDDHPPRPGGGSGRHRADG